MPPEVPAETAWDRRRWETHVQLARNDHAGRPVKRCAFVDEVGRVGVKSAFEIVRQLLVVEDSAQVSGQGVFRAEHCVEGFERRAHLGDVGGRPKVEQVRLDAGRFLPGRLVENRRGEDHIVAGPAERGDQLAHVHGRALATQHRHTEVGA
jgi:hypothetical protein